MSRDTSDPVRRAILKTLGFLGGGFLVGRAHAHHTESHLDDTTAHKLVYQCNKHDEDYLRAILFSVGEMLRKYGDDIELIVTAFGPGIHILAKNPERPVPDDIRERVSSLARYGVAFHACGNTMKSLKWTEEDMLEFVKVVPVGANDLLLLQENGFAYISW